MATKRFTVEITGPTKEIEKLLCLCPRSAHRPGLKHCPVQGGKR
jgi:hypothetical protein